VYVYILLDYISNKFYAEICLHLLRNSRLGNDILQYNKLFLFKLKKVNVICSMTSFFHDFFSC